MSVQSRVWLVVAVAILAAVVLGGTTYSLVRHISFDAQEYDQAIQQQKHARVPSGFLVQHVPFLSKAYRVGLQPGDIITKYNGMPVTNGRTYYAAINRSVAGKVESITLTVMRAGEPIQITVRPGLLGFDGQNWSPLRDTIVDLTRNDRLEEATSLLAEVDSSVLSQEDFLLARILVLPEKDSTQDQRRALLVSQVVSLVSEKDFSLLGRTCIDAHRYKAAQMFLRRAIEADPTDISAQENLGISYVGAGQFDQADHLIEDIIANHSTEMSGYDWHVLLRTRGEVYESRKNHAAAAADFRKAIEMAPDNNDSHLRLRYLLALARMNNLEQFEEGVAFCNKYPTKSYSSRPYDVDALRAYLLGNHDEAKARAAVQKWRTDADAQNWVLHDWAEIRDGSDVVDTWNRLMK